MSPIIIISSWNKKTIYTENETEPLRMMRTTTDEYSFILKPSLIHGVGVFATHPIRSGTRLRLFARSEKTRVIPRGSKYDNFYDQYGVEVEGGFACPEDFGRMSVGWYLNHSDTPNAVHRQYVYYALCDIDDGEEITINYGTLSNDIALYLEDDPES